MIGLFTLECLSIIKEPAPQDLDAGDVRWSLEASRREAILEAARDEANPNWLLAAAEFAHDKGEYRKSEAYLKRLFRASADESRIVARALYIQCANYLAIVNGNMSDRAANKLAKLAAASTDKYVQGAHLLVKGMNWQYGANQTKRRRAERGATLALPMFEKATSLFLEIGEFDLAIRAQFEVARAQFELGRFFLGVDGIEKATGLASEHNCWNFIGRLMLLFASNASDRGYRIGVEDVIRRCLAWSEFLGNAWDRIEALTVLGRFLYYTMPTRETEFTREPDQHLQMASKVAEAYGLTRLTASIDTTRFYLYRKAGDDKKVQALLGDVSEEEEFRKKQDLDNRMEIERLAEAQRRNTALRLHDGVEDSHDAFFVFDALRNSEGICRDFGWVYVNRAAVKICEQSKFQVYLYSEARFLPELKGLDEALLLAVDQRQSYEDVCELVGEKSGTWLQRRVVPSGDGVVISLRDVTAEKNIEAALRMAAESAKRSEITKTAFLASMSHEIRTPLNGVLGLARMLAETDLNPTQREYVNNIVFSGDILLDLIGDVLDLSKIEAQEMHLTPTPVLLSNLVASVVHLFVGQAKERGIELHCDVESTVPATVRVDALRLRQILSNLIGNAVKFTSKGGVRLRVAAEKGGVAFEIQDTGIGIASQDLTAIFDRFRQVGGVAHGGTGLGLPITKALVELMDGEVSVVSELGRGSTFRVWLPLKAVEAKIVPSDQSIPPRFVGRKVLVVDDNPINLIVSSHAIEKFGCETVCVKDGQEALDALSEQHFDLVFLDVQMPLLDGLAATREIRRREGDEQHTLIVALTAGALLQEQQDCFDAGMDDFLTKPITLESIQNTLTKWLPAS
jgi:signal transduction histidine kinase